MMPVCCLSFPYSERCSSRSCFAFETRSRCDARSWSSWASSPLSTWYSCCTNCTFSLMWVMICTVTTVFFFSRCNSSLRSSIFSFSVWFSIFSCSKSMTCRFSANSSFLRRTCSSFVSRFFRDMLEPRTSSTSASLSSSNSSTSWIIFSGIFLPVRAYSAFFAICRLNSWKESRHSIAFCRLASSWFFSSSLMRAAFTCCSRSFRRTECTLWRAFWYLCSVTFPSDCFSAESYDLSCIFRWMTLRCSAVLLCTALSFSSKSWSYLSCSSMSGSGPSSSSSASSSSEGAGFLLRTAAGWGSLEGAEMSSWRMKPIGSNLSMMRALWATLNHGNRPVSTAVIFCLSRGVAVTTNSSKFFAKRRSVRMRDSFLASSFDIRARLPISFRRFSRLNGPSGTAGLDLPPFLPFLPFAASASAFSFSALSLSWCICTASSYVGGGAPRSAESASMTAWLASRTSVSQPIS
mmetsp:Transcript_24113/g.76140  ORF Transcript_24113/g.76140 Transcript_24113/m.76140 type:complete len:463 (+) Transcript_24113:288-1676(+)